MGQVSAEVRFSSAPHLGGDEEEGTRKKGVWADGAGKCRGLSVSTSAVCVRAHVCELEGVWALKRGL